MTAALSTNTINVAIEVLEAEMARLGALPPDDTDDDDRTVLEIMRAVSELRDLLDQQAMP